MHIYEKFVQKKPKNFGIWKFLISFATRKKLINKFITQNYQDHV